MNRQAIMKKWDSWVAYHKGGGGGDWPRIAFESILDQREEQLQLGKRLADYVRMTIEIGVIHAQSPTGIAYRDFIEEWDKWAKPKSKEKPYPPRYDEVYFKGIQWLDSL